MSKLEDEAMRFVKTVLNDEDMNLPEDLKARIIERIGHPTIDELQLRDNMATVYDATKTRAQRLAALEAIIDVWKGI